MKRLGMFLNKSDQFRKLVMENPELPIVFLVDTEVVADLDCGSWYCADINCYIDTILDCDVSDEKLYTDESDFEEDLGDRIYENLDDYFPGHEDDWEPSDEEFEEVLRREMKKFEPYWTKCIVVHGSN